MKGRVKTLAPATYDLLSMELIEEFRASALALVIVDGKFDSGSSAMILAASNLEAAASRRELARRLRELAEECERDATRFACNSIDEGATMVTELIFTELIITELNLKDVTRRNAFDMGRERGRAQIEHMAGMVGASGIATFAGVFKAEGVPATALRMYKIGVMLVTDSGATDDIAVAFGNGFAIGAIDCIDEIVMSSKVDDELD